MTTQEIQSILEGEQGDKQQFEMMKFVIGQQIDRAFRSIHISTGDNFQLRNTPSGPFLSYNDRGNSNYKRASD